MKAAWRFRNWKKYLQQPPFRRQIDIESHKARCRCYIDSNNAAMDFAKIAMRSSLWLNGMGCVAVLYSPQVKLAALHDTLFMFALGALAASVSVGMAYFVQSIVAGSWFTDLPSSFWRRSKECKIFMKRQKILSKIAFAIKVICIILIVFSYTMFGRGSWIGYENLTQKTSHNTEMRI